LIGHPHWLPLVGSVTLASVLKLYDNAESTNALKVRFLLAELRLEYEKVDVPLDAKPVWYGDVHPFSLVPTLVDGDLVVTESNTALRYLADRESRTDLYPRDPARRARVDTLMDSLSLQVRPALWAAEEPIQYGTPEPDDWRTPLHEALAGFERLIADDGYAAGDFSIADCAIAGRMWHLHELPIDLAPYPRLTRALALASARPAYAAAVGTARA
jgi:glutathione S-transferase